MSDDLLNMLVAELLAFSPAAAAVFIERGMACVGCPFARFETVAEAAAIYGFDARDLAGALAPCISRLPNLESPDAARR